MTMVDALGRVGEIQARLVQLNDLVAGTTTSSTVTGAAAAAAAETSATSFADALAAATGIAAPNTVAPTGGATGADIVTAAEKYLGVPYVFGGEDSSGMDCSGLVQTVYADMGIEVPRLVSGQMTIGTEVASLAEAKPGDLIVTGGGEHILIYAGNNQVIHAPYEGRTVCKVDAYMDDSDIDTIRRVILDAAAATASTSVSAAGSATAVTASTAAASSAGPTDLLSAAVASLFTGSATASALSSSALSSSALSPSALSLSALSSSALSPSALSASALSSSALSSSAPSSSALSSSALSNSALSNSALSASALSAYSAFSESGLYS